MAADSHGQVLIVGGGIAGLTLAGALRDTDFDPIVIDSDESPNSESDRRTILLWPEALTLLDGLNISLTSDETASVIDMWTRRQADGTVTHRRESDTMGAITLSYATLRSKLAEILPEGTVQFGRALQSIDTQDDFTTATFANGVREKFDLVVGADGANSRTRALLGGPTPHRFGTRTWTFPLPGWQNQTEATEIWTTDGIVFTVFPAVTGGVGCLTLPGEELKIKSQPRVRDLNDAKAIIDWLLPTALDEADENDVQAMDDIQLTTNMWGDQRIALVGDAAQVQHRLTSLGPTLAIEDAVVLASELRQSGEKLQRRVTEYISRRKARLGHLTTVSSEALGDYETTVPSSYQPLLEIRNAQLKAHFTHLTSSQA